MQIFRLEYRIDQKMQLPVLPKIIQTSKVTNVDDLLRKQSKEGLRCEVKMNMIYRSLIKQNKIERIGYQKLWSRK